MAHFAKVVNGIVVDVIKAEPEFFETFVDSSPGRWIQTSFNTKGNVHYSPTTGLPDGGVPLRANYAGIGFVYNHEHDVFHEPRPVDMNGVECKSWTLSQETWLWVPPIPRPEGAQYWWDEVRQAWI